MIRMHKYVRAGALVLVAAAVGFAGCKRKAAGTQPRDASSVSASTTGPAPPADPNQGLSGVYVISEVDQKGRADMVSQDNEIQFSFLGDGTYTRVTKQKGKVVHTDSGNFQLSPTGQLVLTATVSDKEVVKSPVNKSYKIQLSPGGNELKMWGNSNNIAIFRRTESTSEPAAQGGG